MGSDPGLTPSRAGLTPSRAGLTPSRAPKRARPRDLDGRRGRCRASVYKPGSVGGLATAGRSFLSARGRPRAPAAYPRRLDRDGPSLAAYLALLRLGFTLPPVLPRTRCALTAPFNPCLIPRFPEGHRRCVFCGTVRRASRRAQALPGNLPCGARTFLDRHPEGPVSRPSDRDSTRGNLTG